MPARPPTASRGQPVSCTSTFALGGLLIIPIFAGAGFILNWIF